jgi:hypothetical protein
MEDGKMSSPYKVLSSDSIVLPSGAFFYMKTSSGAYIYKNRYIREYYIVRPSGGKYIIEYYQGDCRC